MCCETFDYEAFMVGKVQQELGIALDDDHEGQRQGQGHRHAEGRDGRRHPAEGGRPYANEWCHHCPDFAAEHADLSCGGLGMEGWTMILVRSEEGEEYLKRRSRPGCSSCAIREEEPKALEVMDRLARKQRERIHPTTRMPTPAG